MEQLVPRRDMVSATRHNRPIHSWSAADNIHPGGIAGNACNRQRQLVIDLREKRRSPTCSISTVQSLAVGGMTTRYDPEHPTVLRPVNRSSTGYAMTSGDGCDLLEPLVR